MNRFLLIAGASGGHLMPVIAVAEELRMRHPDAKLLIACVDTTAGMPAAAMDHLQKRKIDYAKLPIIRFSWKLPRMLLRNVLAASRLIRGFRPDVIFSKGGATGIPLLWLAHRRNVPIVIHESDAVMGRANRFASRFATKVCLGFPVQVNKGVMVSGDEPSTPTHDAARRPFGSAQGDTLPSQLIVTGNPIRPEVLHGDRLKGLQLTGFSGDRPILLVLGGSQGAAAINRIVTEKIDEILRHCDVIHITGPGKAGATERAGYWSRDFAYGELPHLYACSALALARAGAATISELAAWGIPTILVPLAGLAQDHQMMNARAVDKTGGCLLLQQEMLHENLLPAIRQILEDPAKRSAMAQGMRSLSDTTATRRIAEIVVQALAGEPRGA